MAVKVDVARAAEKAVARAVEKAVASAKTEGIAPRLDKEARGVTPELRLPPVAASKRALLLRPNNTGGTNC